MTNEPAERLREILEFERMDMGVLDAALAAERKAGYEDGYTAGVQEGGEDTVERIRAALNALPAYTVTHHSWIEQASAILDAEAAK